jgi:biopolymer transport protein ExbB/TolQ
MGTLIPMGPALLGLATGDVASLASNMQVAFSTTVVGLVIGAIGFFISQVKRRWYATDINNLYFILDILTRDNNKAA